MERIIKGKRYNTATAKKCSGAVDYGSVNELDYYSLALYRKRSGEFFFHRDVFRGPMRDDLIPISVDEARQWAEEHLSSKEYESIFGAVQDDGSRTTVTLSTAAVERARRAAAAQGVTIGAYIESLIQ